MVVLMVAIRARRRVMFFGAVVGVQGGVEILGRGAFDHLIPGVAQQNQVLAVIFADQNQAPLGVQGHDFDHAEATVAHGAGCHAAQPD